MNDLISRLSEIRSNYNCMDENDEPYYRALSEAIQLASAQPERTGKWIDCNNSEHWKCSECGYRGPYSWDDQHGFEEWLSDYCPNCGARMES